MIARLIRTDYATADAYAGVRAIREELMQNMAVVVIEQEKPIGLVLAEDLGMEPHQLVIDCMRGRPSVHPGHSVSEVLSIMRHTKSPALLVYDQEVFIGVVFKDDLVEYLNTSLQDTNSVVSSIVHDLRSPINSLSGLTSILKQTLIKEENQALVEQAEKACNYATDVINELLLVAELDSDDGHFDFEQVELVSLLEECFEMAAPTALKKKVNLVKHVPSFAFTLKADLVKVQRAICNLLTNAIKFTPGDGAVKLSAEISEGHIIISVSDTGIGIPSELQPLIFDKFSKAKRKGTCGELSTGLGMYITRQIIEKHQGSIRFESIPDQGTTFIVRLPGQ